MRLHHWLFAVSVTPVAMAQIYQPATCKNAFTRDQEITEGGKVVAQVYQRMPVLPDSDPAAQYVRLMGERLMNAAPLTPGMEQPWPFRFHVVADSSINAFALPGGTMFVNLGAIQAAENEAQLAGVMGHEMSHVILRHSTCNITKQQKRSIWYGLGELGALGAGAVLGSSSLGQMGAKGIGEVQGLNYLKMSREDEQQADLLGAQIAHNAGYDPDGMPQFFEIIQKKYGSGGAQFLSDHPNPGNRRQYIEAEIAQLEPLEHPTVNTPAFLAMRERAMKLPVYDSKQMQAGAWRQTGLYSSGPDAAAGRQSVPPPLPVQGAPQGSSQTAGAPVLSATEMGLTDILDRQQLPLWSVLVPHSWSSATAANGDVTFAPQGGSGSYGVSYGVVGGVARQSGNGVNDAASLQAVTEVFLRQLIKANQLTQLSQPRAITVSGQPALWTELRGSSPVEIGGTSQPESDVLVTMARPDGDMNYMVLVCPQRDRATMQRLFDRIVASVRF